ncbi:unnamed protein product [Miscanthus lutarioriparius]|uniref:Uncharacterized protein n=1 Tax=Miscanthus lutarioriparius TaxID=422564 RepID=A0A811PZQ9_9POAL|nr:unnamed protein product [Miscanthus lutarioriparius]
MAATKPSSTTPSSLNFLKEGLLLPGRNRILFAAIFTILVAWISILLVANELGVEPLKLEVGRDMDTLMSTDPGGPDYAHLVRDTLDDYRVLFLAGAAYLVSVDITGSVIQLVSLFAAVTTYSGDGEVHTFGALLVALLLASSALVAFLTFRRYHYGLFLAGCLVLLVAFVFYVFLSFLCSLAVVVAMDESTARRRHGAGAIGWAWQLVKGRQRRAMLFVSMMSVLAAVFRPV